MDPIYLDHSATTPLLPEAADAMRAAWDATGPIRGNPSSSHRHGRAARQLLDQARETIARCLDADADEVVITSGATEANNLALFGLVDATAVARMRDPGSPVATVLASSIEHPCVIEPIRQLTRAGLTRTEFSVSSEGIVQISGCDFEAVQLASLMLVNHETGAIQPVADLVDRLPRTVPVHCDAAAAVGKIPVSFRQLKVTTLALSAHKFHGPAGVGALIVRKGTRLRPLLFGGHQQQTRRPGTESVALVVGMATALRWAHAHLAVHLDQVRRLRARFLGRLATEASPIAIQGDGVPHIVNVAFPGLASDALLMALDLDGVSCSTGSACSSGSLLPSPVLRAMMVPDDVLSSAMRFSLSSLTSTEELDEAARRIVHRVRRLRSA